MHVSYHRDPSPTKQLLYFVVMLTNQKHSSRGARKLMKENLKLVWAKFSTLSEAVLVISVYLSMQTHGHIYS